MSENYIKHKYFKINLFDIYESKLSSYYMKKALNING